jgi:hypothetical protein
MKDGIEVTTNFFSRIQTIVHSFDYPHHLLHNSNWTVHVLQGAIHSRRVKFLVLKR